ncbi:MAG: UDP-3-O-acyl-N-acetylglucosamine deacetylase [Gammaproteobacteria bacterium TMED134]|nr:MAG: UDP-3-O-acyl-N-acetylglucosamine deacetylase [Gammaproteobacteria bacterium TMED134]RZO71512.1 MAG: UDP-3-O-acyl-N-acetylglucosamine deacetylase [OM182 bacterium]
MNKANFQRTIKNTIKASGVALHSGKKVNLTLHPAAADAGIVFRRTDLSQPVDLRACAMTVGDTRMATTLESGGVQVSTIEHLMSALAGLGVDNVTVEIDGPELPIMDGSAAPFVFLLQSAGIEGQPNLKKFLRIVKPVQIELDGAEASLEPFDGFKLSYTLDYDHPVFAAHEHRACIECTSVSFLKEISRARTFGFLADYERLKMLNLAQGGSLDNAVVLDESKILNTEGLRVADEFVKHKILDAVGDLYLLRYSLIGWFKGYKSGHGTNNGLLRKLLATPEAFEIISFDDEASLPPSFRHSEAEIEVH